MNILVNDNRLYYSEVKTGDFLIKLDSSNEVEIMYIICYSHSKREYHLQNIKGISHNEKLYTTISDILTDYKDWKVVKSKNVTLGFDSKFIYSTQEA